MVHCLETIRKINDEATRKTSSSTRMDIETRVSVSLAVQRYLRAAERFESASLEFNEACQGLRKVLPRESHFVANVMHQHYVVTCDHEGNFNIDQIDTL